ncbi:hypothetical protein P280DRAFT_462375 [Massarina eburnea CBS 473.64]|uniref:BTB domain-containing protein n=1 Tax=Massarina eburnea CBS 473.64 TaxID=1395130 RepID=A0A6A6RIY3_9PLEO|nr:hypothetical protein P280DRAFT_462375 [Massarina eburnea CBS 473.64]
MDVKRKHEIEAALASEAQAVSSGRLKEDSPLDTSVAFLDFCEACRRGDLKAAQELLQAGVNVNARDQHDYTPLILASLCGHYEVIQLLLENGALCERDTFQGERALYNALNDRIRNLLLSYDYAKSTNPLQPLAAHVSSLLTRPEPKTADITITAYDQSFRLHKFLLAARSPYFAKKLAEAPNTASWKLPHAIPAEALRVALQYLYFSEVSLRNVLHGLSDDEELVVLNGVDKIGRQLEMERMFEDITEVSDRRLLRQKRAEELVRGRDQLELWFRDNVLKNKMIVDTDQVDGIRWDRDNSIFADVLLRADDDDGAKSTIYGVHKAMLLRSEYFLTMFNSPFREAQDARYLHVVNLDCTPQVLETILTFIYTERSDFGLDIAVDVLFAADQLFIEKLKQRAALIISSLGNGSTSTVEAENPRGETDAEEAIDVYEIIRAGWDTRVQRLEEFCARYIAYRLEHYIDEAEFAELVQESAKRVTARQETDTVELIDDIRWYLSERFRLRFEDTHFDEMMDENPKADREALADAVKDLDISDKTAGAVRTLDGEIAGDEFAQDAINYQILLGKIDALLENLGLDA